MGLFFFVVGMEIKRELVAGELRDRAAVALPAMAALGGMIVPGGDLPHDQRRWRTGVTAGASRWPPTSPSPSASSPSSVSRVPASIKVLLLTLAIVDDIGAIVVIAVFYTSDLEPIFLVVAVGVAVVVGVILRLDVTYPAIFSGSG